MFSNKYIFIYSSVMVILVAAILSSTAMVLQPFQERNVKVEKMQNILASAGIDSDKGNAEELYQKLIVDEKLIGMDGNEIQDGRKAFDIDLKIELTKLKDFNEGKSTEKPAFPLFVCKQDDQMIYILPVQGNGLWGPVWGYVALKDDNNTLVGAIFDHKSETPGLGAEISGEDFQKQFIGKKIFDSKGNFVSVAVVKGGVSNSNINPAHGVDAISGGTITSRGVDNMIKNCLQNYQPYFQKSLKPTEEEDEAPAEEIPVNEEAPQEQEEQVVVENETLADHIEIEEETEERQPDTLKDLHIQLPSFLKSSKPSMPSMLVLDTVKNKNI